jgi:ABC-type Fe3+ transport system substrate-binding protein
MKKNKPHQIAQDSERPDLDFLGKIFCPFKESYGNAWRSFADERNASSLCEQTANKAVPDAKLRIAVPTTMKDDTFNDLTHIKDFSKFPSMVTDSGYDEFFGADFISSAETSGLFSAIPLPDAINPVFAGLALRDPKNIFTIFGAMPYILLVNHKRLRGRAVPRRISDLTKSEYAGSVGSLYGRDDITEHLLLEIWKEQGKEGICALARNIGFGGRAPALSEDALAENSDCCVYLISLNFAHAITKHDFLEIVWPEDGALFCPLYAIAKKENSDLARAKQKEIAGFLFGNRLGSILAKDWLSPVNAETDLNLPANARYRWVGWDYIYEMPLSERVRQIEQVFFNAI